jgi:hypothetical protein
MKKLPFLLVVFPGMIFFVNNSFTPIKSDTLYHVYGVVDEYLYTADSGGWQSFKHWLDEQVEAQENPATNEPAPFSEEQHLMDFDAACLEDPDRVCLVSVKTRDGLFEEVLAVMPGEFQGF